MEDIRGNAISMIFQEPMTSLNPLMTIGRQISEAIVLHQRVSRREAMDRAIEALRRVHIPEPERRVHAYPHQLSGGMRQRAMIAMALSCNPKLLIADEPTTALDVTIQAQILDLMRELQETLGTAIVLITHDMGVVAENADRVVVMYAGRKVEEATSDDLFECPGHPYTRGLLGSLPNLEKAARTDRAAGAAQRDQGDGAVAGAAAAGMQLCAALRLRDRTVPCRLSAARTAPARPLGRVLARRPPARGEPHDAPAIWRRGAMTGAAARRRESEKAFSDLHRRVLARRGPGLRGRRRLVRDPARRDAGPRRRERLRQIDGRPHAVEAARTDRRQDRRRRRRHHPPRARRDAAVSPAHADDLSGPLRLAEPAHVGRRDRRRAARHPRRRRRARAPRPGRASVRAGRAAARADRLASRTNSPAGSASASASRAPWR